MARCLTLTILLVLAALGSHGLPMTLEMQRHPHTFRKSANPAVEAAAMGWKERGHTIPMNGGLLTTGGYAVNITIGTGAGEITFNAQVDTGSSNLAVPAVGCVDCGDYPLYNSSASPTAEAFGCADSMCNNCKATALGSDKVPAGGDNATCPFGPPVCIESECGFEIGYGGSSSGLRGNTVKDVVCVGGLCSQMYVNRILNQYPAVTIATGIIGFSFPFNTCSPSCAPTFIDMLVASGELKPHQNTLALCTTGMNGGKLDLGYLNSSRYDESEMKYTPIINERWFNINVTDFLVGGTSIESPAFLNRISADSIGSFVDSGTSIVIVSPFAFLRIQKIMLSDFAHLPGVEALFGTDMGIMGASCAKLNSTEVDMYPRMEYVLSGMDGEESFKVGMEGRNYLMPAGPGQVCLGIAGVPSIGNILGDVFMTSYYIQFDRVGRRMGFAPIKSC